MECVQDNFWARDLIYFQHIPHNLMNLVSWDFEACSVCCTLESTTYHNDFKHKKGKLYLKSRTFSTSSEVKRKYAVYISSYSRWEQFRNIRITCLFKLGFHCWFLRPSTILRLLKESEKIELSKASTRWKRILWPNIANIMDKVIVKWNKENQSTTRAFIPNFQTH